MKLVGYLVKTPEGLWGERGQYYSYILAANGVFVEAEGPLLSARIPVAECQLRGLAPLESLVRLTYGSIPQRFWDLALSVFLAEPDSERYVAIVADGGYNFYVPTQDRSGASVTYEVGNNVVLDLHSHGRMEAFFSGQDDRDETGLKLYGVVGKLHATPVVRLRVGVYGHFRDLAWNDVFDGSLAGALEYEEGEEVVGECDIHRDPKAHGEQLEYLSRWLRGDWWFRG